MNELKDMTISRKQLWYLAGGMLLIALMPIFIYWVSLGRVPSLTAIEARKILQKKSPSAILVDIRTTEEFKRSHVDGSVNWPFESIARVKHLNDIPIDYRHSILIFICDAGLLSARAVRKVDGITTQRIFHVKGGRQAWVKGTTAIEKPFFRLKTQSGVTAPFPFHAETLLEQAIVCFAAFVVKPLYMILSLILIWVLRRQHSLDLLALKWAYIFFLAGESFCALNYLFFDEESYLIEYLHMLGMVAAFGATVFAFIQFMNLRLIHISDRKKKCAAHTLCTDCIKYTETSCGFSHLLIIIAGALIICAFIPLLATTSSISYNTEIFGSDYHYTHPVIFQYYETVYAPTVAMVLLLIALLLLSKNRIPTDQPEIYLFSAGTGLLGFSFFRLILLAVFRDDLLWFVFWEETTELLYIIGTGISLWLFRKKLFNRATG
jgi:rhodanese-related sulfurtransferase